MVLDHYTTSEFFNNHIIKGCIIYDYIILNQYTIKDDCYFVISPVLAIRIERWSGKNYIIDIPLTGFPERIHEGRVLFINSAGLTIDISLIIVIEIFQYLNFVKTMQEDSTVTTHLFLSAYISRMHTF
jgi:hypothetical protein